MHFPDGRQKRIRFVWQKFSWNSVKRGLNSAALLYLKAVGVKKKKKQQIEVTKESSTWQNPTLLLC